MVVKSRSKPNGIVSNSNFAPRRMVGPHVEPLKLHYANGIVSKITYWYISQIRCFVVNDSQLNSIHTRQSNFFMAKLLKVKRHIEPVKLKFLQKCSSMCKNNLINSRLQYTWTAWCKIRKTYRRQQVVPNSQDMWSMWFTSAREGARKMSRIKSLDSITLIFKRT